MLCYILARYAPQVHENILLFFRHKKQSHRNCCRILNINLVIGICKFISSKLWMLPTPTRHLQIQFQQVADASNPGQASANPIPANCRCFQPQDMYLQIHIQQIADASNPNQASANPIPTSCRCFHVRSSPLYVSAYPIPANCRCFQPQPGICKSNSNKLQMLPRPEFTPICICISNSSKLQMLPTPARHLQIQFQQIADAYDPDQASANPIPTSCRYFHIRNSPLYVSTSPIPANCRCFQPRPGIYKSNSSKLQMIPTPGYVSANPIPASCRCFRP